MLVHFLYVEQDHFGAIVFIGQMGPNGYYDEGVHNSSLALEVERRQKPAPVSTKL